MRMSLAQRVLLTWFFTLLFLILLVLKLDQKALVNWFLIFIPKWALDVILLVMLTVSMVGQCKSGYDHRNGSQNMKRKMWYLMAMLLNIAFCLTLCAMLEKHVNLKLTFAFIPLWALLIGGMLELGYSIFCSNLTPNCP
ncbi:transmembrane protein 60 [Protopterus annectens]|uniref:transmembrane protein 60 n=1 Tax=Protopterus annectens TaxID=7888 RepID=UPI001CFB35A4|nr:transmembrane protein 60 [Protopterus annectens]